ncbi:MAG TPA: protein kinase [Acidobacteriota bacterium]|nr:protein kinase [Acidobacteriota bacterium]
MSMLRKKIEGFYLMERIGAGGLSEVYLGINPKTRERRAYKIWGRCPSIGPSTYARFMRQVDMIRSLSHPGIIRILDYGMLDECYFFSMEYMPGGNLRRRIGHGRIPAETAIARMLPVCAAMAYAHECGVIHGHLKPSNILFSQQAESIVSDFGIGKDLNFEKNTLTQSGEIMGAIAYLAPEQRFSAGKVNRRADVYALGAVLYEMLMGFPPLGNFPRPADVDEGFPVFLQSVLDKCLATDAEERFEHAGYLQLELEKCSEQPLPGIRTLNPVIDPTKKTFAIGDPAPMPPIKSDRIESWFDILRRGTTRERLTVVREMVDRILPSEAKTIVKLFPEEGDRVRWGLIRVLGELKIEAATTLILSDLKNSIHTECAIEALGKIGADEAYLPIREFITEHPESAITGLLPLARTGKQRAIKFIQNYLNHEVASVRQAAVHALASIRSAESLQALKEQLCLECDEEVRSDLFSAVHALQAVLLPDVTTIQKAESTPVIRRL